MRSQKGTCCNKKAGSQSKRVGGWWSTDLAAPRGQGGRSDPCAKWYHTAYVVTANTSFAFTIYGMKWDLRPLGILPRGVLVEVYYL